MASPDIPSVSPISVENIQPLTPKSIATINDALCIYWDIDHRKARIPLDALNLAESFQPNLVQRIQSIFTKWEIEYDGKKHIICIPRIRPMPPPKIDKKLVGAVFDLLNVILTKKLASLKGSKYTIEITNKEIFEELEHPEYAILRTPHNANRLVEMILTACQFYKEAGWDVGEPYVVSDPDLLHKAHLENSDIETRVIRRILFRKL